MVRVDTAELGGMPGRATLLIALHAKDTRGTNPVLADKEGLAVAVVVSSTLELFRLQIPQ